MVSHEGRQEITELVTVAGGKEDTICTPCGHCRQLLVEFAPDSLEVYATSPDGTIQLKTTLGELLPYAFRMKNFK
jgi:cytidine deaminase